jgi:hypothetical protein
MMKTFFASLLVLVLAMNVSMAADDPMKSLFMFQQQMAEGGNSAAMMKLGEMYEKGEGTPRNLDKAKEMYQQAKVKGHPKADAALNRLNKQQPRAAQKAQKDKTAQERAAQQKAAQERAAQQKAAQERAAQQKAAQQKAAQQKAAQQKAAREQAAKEKAKREALAKQQQEESARRAAQQKAAQQKAAQQKLAQQKAAQEAAARKQAKEAAKQQAEKKGFKSDPCQGAAARVMSTCKK